MNPMSTSERYVAPRDALELQLAHIWENLLDRRPISVDEDFFTLGGDSLLAMSLLARIVQETGCSLPAAGICQATTIERLAKALHEESHPGDWTPLVPIQTAGTAPPFFCVHPGGGNVLCYLQLSRELGPEQPFFGLQCPGVDGVRQPLTTAADMAREYVAAVQRQQPHGPYALGGWSVGGVLAYEMAQQLRAAGEEVGLLALLDSGVLYACAILMALFPKGDLGVFDLLRLDSKEQVAEFRRRSAPARLVPDDASDELASRIFRLFASNMRAIMHYQAKPYDGCLTLWQAAEGLVQERFEPDREWSRRCDRVEVRVVPGNHLTMIHEPHVQVLAAELRRYLEALR
jgi:thioesterase domain-containing protein/acyl carrier protein